MGLSVWRETSKKLTVYRVCYTPIETLLYTFFLIRTSNFGAKAERSYFFLRFESENVLNMFLKYRLSSTTLSCSSVYHAIRKPHC